MEVPVATNLLRLAYHAGLLGDRVTPFFCSLFARYSASPKPPTLNPIGIYQRARLCCSLVGLLPVWAGVVSGLSLGVGFFMNRESKQDCYFAQFSLGRAIFGDSDSGKKMEATIVYWDYIDRDSGNGNYYSILVLYWDNGKEHGNCFSVLPAQWFQQHCTPGRIGSVA